MANNGLFQFDVTGTKELAKNLAAFGSDKTLKKIVGFSLAAGAKLPLQRARVNARQLGLGMIGFRVRHDADGKRHGVERRYGRIPLSLKANRAYIPRGNRDTFRLNVVARNQRGRGIYRNKAPHAHLIEYGWLHKGGRRIAGRPYLGPALDATAAQVVQIIATRMAGLIDGIKFPTTGRGP